MMLHILADLHVPGSGIHLGLRVAVLPVPLQPSHAATDDGQRWAPEPCSWGWPWGLAVAVGVIVDAEAARTR